MKSLIGWLGMILFEACIEARFKLLNLAKKLNDLVDWLCGFDCVNKAIEKHRYAYKQEGGDRQ